MRSTAKPDDVTWDMLSAAGINPENAHYTPGFSNFVVYSEDGVHRAVFGPAVEHGDDDGADGDLGWQVTIHERIDDTWVMNEWWFNIPTAKEVVAYVAEVLGYNKGGQS